jgi:hypothetical protein
MEVFQLKNGNFVSVEGKIATIFNPKELQGKLDFLNTELAEIPKSPSDAELLEWARTNYPRMDYSQKETSLMAQKETLEKMIKLTKEIK